MENILNAKILRVYISSTDKYEHTSLYETIVYAAKRSGLAGATVFKGTMGYGASSPVQSVKFWELTEKLPLVIEIVDDSAKIDEFIPELQSYFDKIRNGGMITLQPLEKMMVKKGENKNK
jgi:uncharacterized protein